MADSEVQWKSHRLRLMDNGDGTYSFATSGPGGAGDASASNQDEQTALLTTIDADTGSIATSATSLSGATGTEDSAPGANPIGLRVFATRDDSLATLTPAENDEVRLRVDANGALWVQLAGALSADTDSVAVGGVTPGARVSLIDVDETEDEIKATAGTLHSYVITNLAASTRYVRFYNLTAANTTVGTSTIFYGPIAVPAGSGVALPVKIKFSVALSVAATTGVADNDTGAPGANEVIVALVYS